MSSSAISSSAISSSTRSTSATGSSAIGNNAIGDSAAAHLTSRWARRYGLADPAIPAARVTAVDLGRVDAMRGIFAAIAAAAADAGSTTRAGTAHLARGWSLQAAIDRSASLGKGCDDLAAIAATARDAIASFRTAAGRARGMLATATADIDAAIAANPLLGFETTLPIESAVAGLDHERCALTARYGAQASAAADAMDGAGRALNAALTTDPIAALPPALAAVARPAPRTAIERLRDGWVDRIRRAELRRDLHSESASCRKFAASVQRALDRAAAETGRPVQLLDYRPGLFHGQGSAAIALGDIARADSVSVLVPGVDNSPSAMSGPLSTADRLLQATEDAATDGSVAATVVWMGYDIPLSGSMDPESDTIPQAVVREITDHAAAINSDTIADGGRRLAEFSRQLRSHMTPSAALTLVGHSFGSSVVSNAATRLGPDDGVTDIVLMAAPGAGPHVADASDYRAVTPDHAYVLSYPSDTVTQPITDFAAGAGESLLIGPAAAEARVIGRGSASPYGTDPTEASFGAQVIDADSNVPVDHGDPSWLLAGLPGGNILAHAGLDPINNLNQHPLGNYLDGAGLDAVAAVAAGKYTDVPTKSPR